MKHTFKGPEGLSLELDSEQIFPDDPGQGTPAIVILRDKSRREVDSGTFDCACGEGELGHNGTKLTDVQFEWLCAQNDIVDDFIRKNS